VLDEGGEVGRSVTRERHGSFPRLLHVMDRRIAASLLALGLLAPILPAAALTGEEAVDRLHRMPGVQVVLVHRAGELVTVRGNPERPHNVKSLSKSLLSAAAGIALADGTFDGLDQPVAELLPEAIDWSAAPAKRGILLRHLLTMTAGLATTSQRHYGAWVVTTGVRAALEQPLVSAPGQVHPRPATPTCSPPPWPGQAGFDPQYLDRHVLAPLGGEVAA
jgi:CubicO group peptidase (beta-lactamase class C family)